MKFKKSLVDEIIFNDPFLSYELKLQSTSKLRADRTPLGLRPHTPFPVPHIRIPWPGLQTHTHPALSTPPLIPIRLKKLDHEAFWGVPM